MKKVAFLTLTSMFLFHCTMTGQNKKDQAAKPEDKKETVVLMKTTMGDMKI
jgi:hypothetical protein